MTKPTQAQIEAAAKALSQDLLEAWISNIDPEDDAAILNRWDSLIKKYTDATIERCAQVVKDAANRHDSPIGCEPYTRAQLLEIYAAIRALKDH